MEALTIVDESLSICCLCSVGAGGGVYTNGDGYSDGKYVGIHAGKFRFYCWQCYETRRSEVPDLNEAIDAAFSQRGWCGFLEAYRGRCQNKKPCSKHENQRCWQCGLPATRNCDDAGALVCGIPECAEHRHYERHSMR